jgi:hypothetical protein
MCTVGSLVSYKSLSVPAPPSVFLPCGVGFEVVREVRVSVSCVRLPPKSLPPVQSFCRLFTGTGTKTNEGARRPCPTTSCGWARGAPVALTLTALAPEFPRDLIAVLLYVSFQVSA